MVFVFVRLYEIVEKISLQCVIASVLDHESRSYTTKINRYVGYYLGHRLPTSIIAFCPSLDYIEFGDLVVFDICRISFQICAHWIEFSFNFTLHSNWDDSAGKKMFGNNRRCVWYDGPILVDNSLVKRHNNAVIVLHPNHYNQLVIRFMTKVKKSSKSPPGGRGLSQLSINQSIWMLS